MIKYKLKSIAFYNSMTKQLIKEINYHPFLDILFDILPLDSSFNGGIGGIGEINLLSKKEYDSKLKLEEKIKKLKIKEAGNIF